MNRKLMESILLELGYEFDDDIWEKAKVWRDFQQDVVHGKRHWTGVLGDELQQILHSMTGGLRMSKRIDRLIETYSEYDSRRLCEIYNRTRNAVDGRSWYSVMNKASGKVLSTRKDVTYYDFLDIYRWWDKEE